jgi:hypothetical protein
MPRQASSAARPLTDHEEIRNWAEERGGKPSCVRGTGGESDVGMIRIDFPGYSGEGSLEEISWDEWFDKFDERNLALLVQDETAGGQTSNFNKLVSRGTAQSRGRRSRTRSATRARGTSRTEGRSKRQKSAAARGRSSSRGRSSRSGTSGARRRTTAASRSEARGRSSRAEGRRSNRSTQVRGKKVNGSAQRSSRRRAA